jgi:hypothetical protein
MVTFTFTCHMVGTPEATRTVRFRHTHTEGAWEFFEAHHRREGEAVVRLAMTA